MRRGAASLAFAAAVAFAPAALASAAGERMARIPAGQYTPFLRLKAPNEASPPPVNAIFIPAFRLDVEPVTDADFLAFVTARPEWRRSRAKALFVDGRYLRRWRSDAELPDAASGDEPVVNVSWFAAQAYCRARGARLPTTEQWEYALADAGRHQAEVRLRSLNWFAQPNGERPPVIGREPPNGYGVADMVGLVWEWTLDFDAYAVAAESRDPNGKDSALVCGGAAAGATDATDYPGFMRFSLRSSLKASYTSDNLGFRCAQEAP